MITSKVINGVLINLIRPLSEVESDSLESHLFETVLNRRGLDNEEVFVISKPTTDEGITFSGFSLLGYKFHQSLENNETAINDLQIQLIHFARLWMVMSGKLISVEH